MNQARMKAVWLGLNVANNVCGSSVHSGADPKFQDRGVGAEGITFGIGRS